MKKFIYDIFCLSSIDKIKWSKNFFWPISPEKTQQILNKILEINFESLEKEKNLSLEIVFLPTITLGIHILSYLITYYLKKIR